MSKLLCWILNISQRCTDSHDAFINGKASCCPNQPCCQLNWFYVRVWIQECSHTIPFCKNILRKFWFCAGEEWKQISEVAVKQNCSLWSALNVVTVLLFRRKWPRAFFLWRVFDMFFFNLLFVVGFCAKWNLRISWSQVGGFLYSKTFHLQENVPYEIPL